MKPATQHLWARFVADHPELRPCEGVLLAAHGAMMRCFRAGGKLLACGNGGSAADADHIVGELMKGFLLRRPAPAGFAAKLRDTWGGAEADAQAAALAAGLQGALPAISLTAHAALTSAFANDVAADMAFAQQVYGYGMPGDVLLAISTSGHSANVCKAVRVARAKDMISIGLTGEGGGALAALCDICIAVPERETYRVQQLHLPVYHLLCALSESECFDV
ncbi:MAG: SIS domain-containing protein [Clostridia bacterium]|nr:SIS domain-containing protein [Clostridia bacterium]